MRLVLLGTGLLLLTTLALSLCLFLGIWLSKGHMPGFWRKALWWNLAMLPVLVFVLLPALLGLMGSRFVHTRRDESNYQGPQLDAQGNWQLQGRKTLLAAVSPSHSVLFTNQQGQELRAFVVPAKQAPARATVLLVHGLFRGGLELEPVAAMFHELGAEVMLLECRNHGGSYRAPATFGLQEAADVEAAVGWLRQRKGGPTAPLVLFGVSMGSITVARAAPQIPELAGLVLDAPATSLRDTAQRMLGKDGLGIPAPLASLTLYALQCWSGFDMSQVRPLDDYPKLDPAVPVLFIGGGQDNRMPPEVVKQAFQALPATDSTKQLWIHQPSGHGKVWHDAADAYRQHLAEFMDRVGKK